MKQAGIKQGQNHSWMGKDSGPDEELGETRGSEEEGAGEERGSLAGNSTGSATCPQSQEQLASRSQTHPPVGRESRVFS